MNFTNQTDANISRDFAEAKKRIAERNYEETIKRVAQNIKESTLIMDGYLITDEQAERTAIRMFETSKEAGNINELNELVRA